MVLLEVCANSIQSAIHAQNGGADRIELCQNLEEGGITPSYGLIEICKSELRIPVHVLIRPRTGDFIYDKYEFATMLTDIRICRDLQCEGVVTGVLNHEGAVDIKRCQELVQAAWPMQVTFHRAFDDCADQFKALEDVIATRCTRILTSGGLQSAEHGINVLENLIRKAAGRISILPGAGITSKNAANIVQVTGATEIHASAKRSVPVDNFRSKNFATSRLETDPSQVRMIVASMTPEH